MDLVVLQPFEVLRPRRHLHHQRLRGHEQAQGADRFGSFAAGRGKASGPEGGASPYPETRNPGGFGKNSFVRLPSRLSNGIEVMKAHELTGLKQGAQAPSMDLSKKSAPSRNPKSCTADPGSETVAAKKSITATPTPQPNVGVSSTVGLQALRMKGLGSSSHSPKPFSL